MGSLLRGGQEDYVEAKLLSRMTINSLATEFPLLLIRVILLYFEIVNILHARAVFGHVRGWSSGSKVELAQSHAEMAMQNVVNKVKSAALGVADSLTPVLKVGPLG